MAGLIDYFWFAGSIALAIIIIAYVSLHMEGFLYFFSLKRSKSLDDDTLHFIFNILRVLWIIIAVMFLAWTAQFLAIPYGDMAWALVVGFIFAVFIFCFVVVIFWIFAKLLSNRIEISKQKALADPTSYVRPGVLDFYEMFLKYFIYAIGMVFALLAALAMVPNSDQRQLIYDLINATSIDTNRIMGTLEVYAILMAVIFLVWKLISLMLDDFKKKSNKFPPRVLDLVKSLTRWGIIWLASVISLTIILDLIGFQYVELVVVLIVAATFVILLAVAISPTTKEGFSGVVLLITDTVNREDWIEIEGIGQGKVLSQNLITTRIQTEPGDLVDIPNSRMSASVIRNLTKAGRVLLEVPVPGELTAETAIEAACRVEGVMHDPRPHVASIIAEDGQRRVIKFYTSHFAKQNKIIEMVSEGLLKAQSP
ncbi:MAG: mechanosensitive ion channel family protein [Euryarchaeota archaeon]|nr:mechanosensitive ion channel family protein [Euryarchaeota archaeon]